MGRAGAGGGGHGGGSHGGHSFSSHSSGGHHVSSHRAGSSSFSSRSGSSRSYTGSPRGGHTTVHHTNVYNYGGSYSRGYGSYGRGYVGRRSSVEQAASAVHTMVCAIIIICVISVMLTVLLSISSGPTSTIVRTKIDNPQAWVNDCVTDELYWFDNVNGTEKRLRAFYDETGVQPYIYLRAYDSSLQSDYAKEEWANSYFDEMGYADNAFLYVYFAEQDTDNDVGFMCYVAGNRATTIFDSEAIDIFWNYVDGNWYSDMSTDDLFVKIFTKTSDAIMHVSTTGNDVLKTVILVVAGIVILVIASAAVLKSRKLKAEKAKADAEILKTPVRGVSADEDALVDKYKEDK